MAESNDTPADVAVTATRAVDLIDNNLSRAAAILDLVAHTDASSLDDGSLSDAAETAKLLVSEAKAAADELHETACRLARAQEVRS